MWRKFKNLNPQKKIVIEISLLVILVLIVTGVIFLMMPKKEKSGKTEEPKIEKDDPQKIVAEEQDGAEVDIADILKGYTDDITNGIDVSVWQGVIDWEQVANSGVDFAMIRVGFRSLDTGILKADANAKYNMQQATKYGIKVGVYFFSTAVSKAEAIEEADWVADYIAKYQITYPVAYDCEGYDTPGNRQYEMTMEERTDVAIAFMEQIANRGYTPMFYASKSALQDAPSWDVKRISSLYSIWVAEYAMLSYPQTPASSYSGVHAMWQHTNHGTVPGIEGTVDLNVAYFGSDTTKGPQDTDAPEEVKPDVENGMVFTAVNETVTAWEKTNLRTSPSQADDSNIASTLSNGQTATRVGICQSSGWSKLLFNGNTYYAVTSLLTTDLSYKPPVDDGIKTVFADRNEQVTPKEAVNLRKKPSVDDSIAPVVVKIERGQVVTRTGINLDVGWSRVVYNGQTLYCISSYLDLVQ